MEDEEKKQQATYLQMGNKRNDQDMKIHGKRPREWDKKKEDINEAPDKIYHVNIQPKTVETWKL